MTGQFSWSTSEKGKELINWMEEYYENKIKEMPEGATSGVMMGKAIGDSIREKANSKGIPPDEAVNYFFKKVLKK